MFGVLGGFFSLSSWNQETAWESQFALGSVFVALYCKGSRKISPKCAEKGWQLERKWKNFSKENLHNFPSPPNFFSFIYSFWGRRTYIMYLSFWRPEPPPFPGSAVPGQQLESWGWFLEQPCRYQATPALSPGGTKHRPPSAQLLFQLLQTIPADTDSILPLSWTPRPFLQQPPVRGRAVSRADLPTRSWLLNLRLLPRNIRQDSAARNSEVTLSQGPNTQA